MESERKKKHVTHSVKEMQSEMFEIKKKLSILIAENKEFK